MEPFVRYRSSIQVRVKRVLSALHESNGLTKDRPDLSSERASNIDKTGTFRQ
jgi:hypothetical protein